MSGKSLKEVNWAKVGVSALSGGVSAAVPGGFITAAVIGGTTDVAFDMIDGNINSVGDAVKSFAWGAVKEVVSQGVGKALDKGIGKLAGKFAGKSGSGSIPKPNSGQGFSPKGYNPQPGERTLKGFVNNNVSQSAEISLYTDSPGFNNIGKNGGEFLRFGTVSGRHGIEGPHVHLPSRNVFGDNIRGGCFNTKKGIGVNSPTKKDVKHLYQYLFNGKYHR